MVDFQLLSLITGRVNQLFHISTDHHSTIPLFLVKSPSKTIRKWSKTIQKWSKTIQKWSKNHQKKGTEKHQETIQNPSWERLPHWHHARNLRRPPMPCRRLNPPWPWRRMGTTGTGPRRRSPRRRLWGGLGVLQMVDFHPEKWHFTGKNGDVLWDTVSVSEKNDGQMGMSIIE